MGSQLEPVNEVHANAVLIGHATRWDQRDVLIQAKGYIDQNPQVRVLVYRTEQVTKLELPTELVAPFEAVAVELHKREGQLIIVAANMWLRRFADFALQLVFRRNKDVKIPVLKTYDEALAWIKANLGI